MIEAAVEAGVYYVRVESHGDGTGGYALHVRRRTVRRNTYGMEFALIPAGQFDMGSGSDEADSDEQPVSPVQISQPFYMGKHEVTQGQWKKVMGEDSNPSRSRICDECPVEWVTWEEVIEFVRRLNETLGTTAYRLPTEAEWEYAARAGQEGERYAPLDDIAWHQGNSGGMTQRVGEKRANAFGLHDMLGNVWEWVLDWHGPYLNGPVTDPTGPVRGSERVRRGGSWYSHASSCRAANRYSSRPRRRASNLGFRLVLTNAGTPSGEPHPLSEAENSPLLEIGSTLEGKFDAIDDSDFFRLDLTEKTNLLLYTKGSLRTAGTLWKQVETQKFELVASQRGSGGADNFVIEVSLEPGIYFVEVKGALLGTGSYSLHAERPVQSAINACLTDKETNCGSDAIRMEFIELPDSDTFEETSEYAFYMGSNSVEAHRSERPVTQVRISQPFYMGKYEVTQRQWEAVMGRGSNPSKPEDRDCMECPVDSVTWNQVQEFIRRLNQVADGERTFRLPTEAEWEYAARAGTTGERYSDDLAQIAWFEDNSVAGSYPVGQRLPNTFGLYDMLGNVSEWVQDWSGGKYPGGEVSVQDPIGPRTGQTKIARGCNWFSPFRNCRSASRFKYGADNFSNGLGFRLVTDGWRRPPPGHVLDDHPDNPLETSTHHLPFNAFLEFGGDLADSGDVDLFKFRVRDRTIARFYISGGLEAVLELGILTEWKEPAGIGRQQSCENQTIDSIIERELDPGWYCLQVRLKHENGVGGSYTLVAETFRTARPKLGSPVRYMAYNKTLPFTGPREGTVGDTIPIFDSDLESNPISFQFSKVDEVTRFAIYLSTSTEAETTEAVTMFVPGTMVEDPNADETKNSNFPVVIDVRPEDDFIVGVDTEVDGHESPYTLLVEEIRPVRELDVWTNSIGMQFVQLPHSDELKKEPINFTFYMGSDPDEGRTDQGSARIEDYDGKGVLFPPPVCRKISEFWIGKYEVTECEWAQLMKYPAKDGKDMNGEQLKKLCDPNGRRPIVNVTLVDAERFVEQLNAKVPRDGYTYRLLTEAHWEYAAQAGEYGERFSEHTDEISWSLSNSGDSDMNPELKPVGTRRPNAFGLHDMLGNAWEWTTDAYPRSANAVLHVGIEVVESNEVQKGLAIVGTSIGIGAAVGSIVPGVGTLVGTGTATVIGVGIAGVNWFFRTQQENEARVIRGGSFKSHRDLSTSSVRMPAWVGSETIALPNNKREALDHVLDIAEGSAVPKVATYISILRTAAEVGEVVGKNVARAKALGDVKSWGIEVTKLGLSHLNFSAKEATSLDHLGFRVAMIENKGVWDFESPFGCE